MDKKELKKIIRYRYWSLRAFCKEKGLDETWFNSWLNKDKKYNEAKLICEKEFGGLNE